MSVYFFNGATEPRRYCDIAPMACIAQFHVRPTCGVSARQGEFLELPSFNYQFPLVKIEVRR